MKKVSVREFQQKASKYLDQLPITLTIWGKPVAVIKPHKGTKEKVKTNAGFIPQPVYKGAPIIRDDEQLTPGQRMLKQLTTPHGETRSSVVTDGQPLEDPVDAGTPASAGVGIMPKEPRPTLHSVIVYCPHCNAPCWKEYANQHYMDNHEI